MKEVKDIIEILNKKRFLLHDEKELQRQVHTELLKHFRTDQLEAEHYLDKGSIIDFFILPGIGIEVKIKGGKREIYRQCIRYCGFERIKALILLTNISIGFPEEINGKPCYIVKLGKAWL